MCCRPHRLGLRQPWDWWVLGLGRRHCCIPASMSISAPGQGEQWILPLMPTPFAQEQSPGSQASLVAMPEAPEVLEETVTVEEDPGTPTSHVSIVTSEDGTTRRTETKV